MESMTYDIPIDIKTSEEKWLKIFSKKAFIAVLITSVISFGIFRLFSILGYTVAGVIIGILLILIIFLITTLKVPYTWNLSGGGLTLDIYLFKVFVATRRKVVYVKGYDRGI